MKEWQTSNSMSVNSVLRISQMHKAKRAICVYIEKCDAEMRNNKFVGFTFVTKHRTGLNCLLAEC
jgi:hypothetical protein